VPSAWDWCLVSLSSRDRLLFHRFGYGFASFYILIIWIMIIEVKCKLCGQLLPLNAFEAVADWITVYIADFFGYAV